MLIRVNSGRLINLLHVAEIIVRDDTGDPYRVVLDNGSIINISEDYREHFINKTREYNFFFKK